MELTAGYDGLRHSSSCPPLLHQPPVREVWLAGHPALPGQHPGLLAAVGDGHEDGNVDRNQQQREGQNDSLRALEEGHLQTGCLEPREHHTLHLSPLFSGYPHWQILLSPSFSSEAAATDLASSLSHLLLSVALHPLNGVLGLCRPLSMDLHDVPCQHTLALFVHSPLKF